MKNLLIIALLFISISSNSQIDFEQGYFIKNNGEIEKCLIKNFDWKNNPIDIVYKKLATSKRNVITISEISEFGIDNISKFIRDTVDIDRSSENLANMSNKRNPTFKKEILFLKVLVEGSASLYVYKDRSLLRFFLANLANL